MHQEAEKLIVKDFSYLPDDLWCLLHERQNNHSMRLYLLPRLLLKRRKNLTGQRDNEKKTKFVAFQGLPPVHSYLDLHIRT